MRQLIRKIPLSIRRMLPVFIGVFIIVYSFIIIMRYNNYETNNDNDAPDQNIPTTGGGTTETTTMAANKENAQEEEDVPINAKELRRTHIFYYPWYANMETDGAWNHWNHRVLSHWNPETAQKYLRDVNYVPPDDIGCNFYPKLGPYSSMNDEVVMEHMNKLKDYVVVVSWWGRPDVNDAKDGEGYSTDLVMPKLFKAAEKTGAKIAFHLEPYPCK